MDRSPTMRPLTWRRLTPSETSLAREVFGDGLDAARVRILALPVWPRAFVAGPSLIAWPAVAARVDFGGAPLLIQATLVHELTHVWQAQRGVFLPLAKLRAGDSPRSYAYDLPCGAPFAALNIEQQAMIVQHAFLASRGAEAPFARRLYTELESGWRSV
ncbi:MAG TPA: hypothetical protein VGH86_06395 [Phenylobacterium sp.]